MKESWPQQPLHNAPDKSGPGGPAPATETKDMKEVKFDELDVAIKKSPLFKRFFFYRGMPAIDLIWKMAKESEAEGIDPGLLNRLLQEDIENTRSYVSKMREDHSRGVYARATGERLVEGGEERLKRLQDVAKERGIPTIVQ